MRVSTCRGHKGASDCPTAGITGSCVQTTQMGARNQTLEFCLKLSLLKSSVDSKPPSISPAPSTCLFIRSQTSGHLFWCHHQFPAVSPSALLNLLLSYFSFLNWTICFVGTKAGGSVGAYVWVWVWCLPGAHRVPGTCVLGEKTYL